MSDAALTERARIQGLVEGRTLVDALTDTVGRYGDQPAYSDKHHVPEGESWRTLTWTETREPAFDLAAGLIEAGLAVGDTVAIMANNRIEHFLADMGAVHAAATPMSIYNTLSPEQIAYIAAQARPTVIFLENADHRARWAKALDEVDSIRKVVMIDEDWDDLVAAGAAYRVANPGAVEARVAELNPEAPATILYTSGTTGSPKGVVLTHHNILFETVGTQESAGLFEPQTGVSYLPLAHIAERVLGLYGPQVIGGPRARDRRPGAAARDAR